MLKRISMASFVLVSGVVLGLGCDGNDNSDPDAGADAGAPTKPTRTAKVEPLKATFTQENFTTTYEAKISNPDADELVFAWSGPRCGVFQPDKVTCSDKACTTTFSWDHGSPACPPHNNHDDTTVVLQVIGKRSGHNVVCIYKGSETGVGNKCYENGWGASEIGVTQPNQVFLRYHLPLGTSCSVVNLVQVVSYRSKKTNLVEVPHSKGMNRDGLPGYEIPDDRDDVAGYVVDKFQKPGEPSDPYYGGSVQGTHEQDAELDDRPGNTLNGHIARFEVCAHCSGAPSDADYGKYLDCLTWEHDPEIPIVRKADPQPTQKPTPEFNAAVAKWNDRHGYMMVIK